jgi:hypothetical protein
MYMAGEMAGWTLGAELSGISAREMTGGTLGAELLGM